MYNPDLLLPGFPPSSIDVAKILVIPLATQANANWDIDSDYGSEGQLYTTHQELDAVTTYNVTQNILYGVDVSGILTALIAEDNVGLQLTQSAAGHNVGVVGFYLQYS